MTINTGNRLYAMPDEGGSQNAWGGELNGAAGTGAAVLPDVPDNTKPVPVVETGRSWDTDIQDALDRGQQALVDALEAKTRADLTLLKDGTEAMTGRLDLEVGAAVQSIIQTGQSGTVNIDVGLSDFHLIDATGPITVVDLGTPLDVGATFIQMIVVEIAGNGNAVSGWIAANGVQWHLGAEPVHSTGVDTYVLYRVQGGSWIGVRSIENAS